MRSVIVKTKLLLLTLLSLPVQADSVYSPRVIDGDTFDTGVRPFHELVSMKARIIGIDTPEMHGSCLQEKVAAAKAKEFLVQLFYNKRVDYDVIRYDKYGGRVNVNAFVDGKNVATLLIESGLARPYSGGIRQSWCIQE